MKKSIFSKEKFETHQRQEKIQEEMMSIQMKYQREIDRLEKELQSLKKQLLLTKDRNTSVKKIRRVKVEEKRRSSHMKRRRIFHRNR